MRNMSRCASTKALSIVFSVTLVVLLNSSCGLLAAWTSTPDDGAIWQVDAGPSDSTSNDFGSPPDHHVADRVALSDAAPDAGPSRDSATRDAAGTDATTIEAGGGVDGCSVGSVVAPGGLAPTGRIAVAADDQGAAIAWAAVSGGATHVYAFHVDNNRVASGPQSISDPGFAPGQLTLAASGGLFRAVWVDANRMYSNGLTAPSTRVNNPDVMLPGAAAASPAIAPRGLAFGLVWIDSGTGAPVLQYSSLSTAGGLQPPSFTLIAGNSPTTTALAGSGSDLGLVWSALDVNLGVDTFILFESLSRDGTVSESPTTVYQGPQTAHCPAIAAAGAGDFGIVWRQANGMIDDTVLFSLVVGGDAATSPVPIGNAPQASCDNGPNIAWNGSEFGVVYVEATTFTLQLIRLDSRGAAIGDPIPVPGIDSNSSTALTAQGDDFLVAGTSWAYIIVVQLPATPVLVRVHCPQ